MSSRVHDTLSTVVSSWSCSIGLSCCDLSTHGSTPELNCSRSATLNGSCYFEWIIISDLQHIHNLHWTASQAASAMLTAHWMYLIAIYIEMVSQTIMKLTERSTQRTWNMMWKMVSESKSLMKTFLATKQRNGRRHLSRKLPRRTHPSTRTRSLPSRKLNTEAMDEALDIV